MIPTVLPTPCPKCGAAPREVDLSKLLKKENAGTAWVPSCECAEAIRKEQEAQDYLRYRTQLAALRFQKLGLGDPKKIGKGLPITTDMAWYHPNKAFAEGRHLIVSGNVGNGKTTTMLRVAWFLCMAGRRPRGGYIPTMVQKFRSEDGREHIEDVMDGDFLILDDMDKLRGTEYQMEVFSSIINHYDVNNRPILSTMNLLPNLLGKRLISNGVPADIAESLASRVRHRADFITAPGPDFRLQEER